MNTQHSLSLVFALQILVDVVVGELTELVHVGLVNGMAGQFDLFAGTKGAHFEAFFGEKAVRLHRAIHVRRTNDRNGQFTDVGRWPCAGASRSTLGAVFVPAAYG